MSWSLFFREHAALGLVPDLGTDAGGTANLRARVATLSSHWSRVAERLSEIRLDATGMSSKSSAAVGQIID